MSYAAVSDNAPRGDRYTNQLMTLIGQHVRQHVAGQVSALEAKIAALKFEVEAQNAEMATLRSELAALHSRDDASEATSAALRSEIAAKAIDRDEIVQLRERLAAIEAKGTPTYVGVYQPDTTYQRGDCATFNGGLWHCNRPTAQKPGDEGSGWQLCVKSGGDIAEKRISTLEREMRELTKPRTNSATAEPRK